MVSLPSFTQRMDISVIFLVSISLLKDADDIVCRNGVSRSRDVDRLIELTEVDERVSCGGGTRRRCARACRSCCCTERIRIQLQRNLFFHLMNVKGAFVNPEINICLKLFDTLEKLGRALLSLWRGCPTRVQELRQGILAKRDGEAAQFLPIERDGPMIGQCGFLCKVKYIVDSRGIVATRRNTCVACKFAFVSYQLAF